MSTSRVLASAAALKILSHLFMTLHISGSHYVLSEPTKTHIHSLSTHTRINICCCVSSQGLQPDSSVSEGSKALASTHLPATDKTWLIPRVVTGQHAERQQHSTMDSVTPPLLTILSPSTLLLLQMTRCEKEGPAHFCEGILQE